MGDSKSAEKEHETEKFVSPLRLSTITKYIWR